MIRRLALWAIILLLIAVPLAGIVLRPSPALTQGDKPAGLLADFDLADGDYALAVSYGDAAGPSRIDDDALIAAHEAAIAVNLSVADFMPGEGRGGIYLYGFRNGEKIAGRVVSRADQIVLPEPLRAGGKSVVRNRVEGNRAEISATTARLKTEGALLDLSGIPTPQEIGPEFYFRIWLPTLALPEGDDFDTDAYAQELSQRMRTALGDGEYELAVELSSERTPRTFSLFDAAGNVLYDDGRKPLHLPLTLYDFSATVRAEPALRDVAAKMDLQALVTERRGEALVINAWEDVTGTRPAPDEIYIDNYDASGSVGPVIEQSYSLTYWE